MPDYTTEDILSQLKSQPGLWDKINSLVGANLQSAGDIGKIVGGMVTAPVNAANSLIQQMQNGPPHST